MRARVLVVGLAGAAYVGASHWLMTSAPASDWNAVVVVGPMLVLAALFAWQRRQRALAALAALLTAGLVFQGWHGGGFAPGSIYVAQHVVIHLLLAVAFALTLQRGHEPLITALARRVHRHMSAGRAAYTRHLTLAWTLYFVAMACVSIGLYAFAPFATWAAFANLVTPLAMLAMFVGEYALRYRLHPEFERTTLTQAMHAWTDRGSLPAAPPARTTTHE